MLPLTQTSLRPLDDMGDRLQNALVVDSTESHARGPTHLLEHGSTLVGLAQFWRGGPDDLAIFVGECGRLPSSATAPTRSSTSGTSAVLRRCLILDVWAAEVLTTRSRKDLFKIDFAVFDGSQSAVQGRAPLIARASRLALNIKFVGQFVDDFSRMWIHWWKEDAVNEGGMSKPLLLYAVHAGD